MKRHSDIRGHWSCSEESNLDTERHACGCQNLPSSSAYFSLPNGSSKGRANYFMNLHKEVKPESPSGQQASTLLDLMTIRAFHSNILNRHSLGTAVGFRIKEGKLTDVPAILVFVARKVHRKWLNNIQCLPTTIKGPRGIWCDVDVIEFSYNVDPASKEELYNELVDGLRGKDPCIGSGSQVASQETFGSLGAIVKSRTGKKQVGFLTNRHVSVDMDYPNQKMFHPLPSNLCPGVYLGAVERTTSLVKDYLWYGIYAGTNFESFVRADGAFIPFTDNFNMSNVTTLVKGVGEIGNVKAIDLKSPIKSVVGREVVTVGRSSGLTKGTVMGYALEYNNEKRMCFFTDFLVVGENHEIFDLEGDNGSLIILSAQNGEKPQPIGIILSGTTNRGRLKIDKRHGPENWTSGVDLGRLLDLLELDLITKPEGLQGVEEQRMAVIAATDSVGAVSSPKIEEIDLNNAEFQEPFMWKPSKLEEHSTINLSSVARTQENHPQSEHLLTTRSSPDANESRVSSHSGHLRPKRRCLEPTCGDDI